MIGRILTSAKWFEAEVKEEEERRDKDALHHVSVYLLKESEDGVEIETRRSKVQHSSRRRCTSGPS